MIKRFNEFLTESVDDVKEIKKGTKVSYKGSTYTVDSNDGFMLSLIDDDGETLDVNYSMFKQSGMIKY